MEQLMFTAPGEYVWREVPEPRLTGPDQALVRPILVIGCDLDIAVAQGRAPLPPGYAVGHEGIAEVIAVGEAVREVRVGDRVVVPFQINCGKCRECRRGMTGSCASVPPRAMYGLGSIAGMDGGGFLGDVVLVPFADAMLVPVPEGIDPVSIASMSDNIPDGWRTVGPHLALLRGLAAPDRRVLVVGGLSIGLYAAAFAVALGAQVDYVDTDVKRLAAAEKLGAQTHDLPEPGKSWEPYPVTVHTSADPHMLATTLRATWPGGVCTDTGIYYQGAVELPLLEMYGRGVQFITGRANARADIPEILELLANGCDLAPVVDQVLPWDAAAETWPTMNSKVVFTR